MNNLDLTTIRIARRLFRFLIDPEIRERALGDMDEIYYTLRTEKGVIYANVWILKQIIKSIIPFLFDSIRWSVVMLGNTIKLTLRHIRKHKVHSTIHVSGLTVGLACTILIFMWVMDELNYDRFHENLPRIHRLVLQNLERGNYGTSTPAPLAKVVRESIPELEAVTRIQSRRAVPVRYENQVFTDWEGIAADPTLFSTFTFPLTAGDPASALNETNSIVLTREKAKLCFAETEPIGKLIELDKQIFVVTGVLDEIPANSELKFDYIRSVEGLSEITDYRAFIWNWFAFDTYVLLRPETDPMTVNEKIARFLNENRPWSNAEWNLFLQPMSKIHLFDLGGGGPIQYVIIFGTVAVLVLFLACINFINLSTAQSVLRAKEVGLRKVVGSSRFEIMRQFFLESFVYTGIAGLLALALAYLLIPLFNQLSGKQIGFNLYDTRLLFSVAGIIFITGIFSGLYPAYRFSLFSPIHALKSNFLGRAFSLKGKAEGFRLRTILVVIQFTVSIALMLGTTIIRNQIHFMKTADLGFDVDGLVQLSIPESEEDSTLLLKQSLQQNALIQSVAWHGRRGYGGNLAWEGMPDDEEYLNHLCNNVGYRVVDIDFVKTRGMHIVEGRDFSHEYPSDLTQAYLVNEEAVKKWELNDPIGKRFELNHNEGVIVGIFKNYYFQGVRSELKPSVLYLTPSTHWDGQSYLTVRLNPSEIEEGLKLLASVWHEHIPDYPMDFKFVDSMIQDRYRFEYRLGSLFDVFSLLTLFISGMGLFGMASFIVQRRIKEIGVRKVMGASKSTILRIMSGDFSKSVLISNILAWPLAYFSMNHWLQSYPYRWEIQWWIFPVVGVAALLIALVTVSYHSMKAVRLNPVDALRYE